MRAIKRKHIVKRGAVLIAAFLLIFLSMSTAKAQAEEMPESRSCSLWVQSPAGGSVDAKFTLWKVADWQNKDTSGSFKLVDALRKNSQAIDLSGLDMKSADKNAKIALTVYNAVQNTPSLKAVATDVEVKASNGKAAKVAENLETGLYLIMGEGLDGTVMNPVLVSLPITSDNGWNYDVDIEATKFSKPQQADKLKIRKVWSGDSQADRPDSIAVLVTYNDKVNRVQKEVVLTKAENYQKELDLKDFGLSKVGNYSYWSASEEKSGTAYSQSVSSMVETENGVKVCTITITNTKTTPHNNTTDHPKTGDRTDLMLWIVVFVAAALILVFLGTLLLRSRKDRE